MNTTSTRLRPYRRVNTELVHWWELMVERKQVHFFFRRTKLSGRDVSSAPESVRQATRPSGSSREMIPLIEPRRALTRSPGWKSAESLNPSTIWVMAS